MSHEAERAPEPGSTDPNKGPSAAEAAAAEAEASRASLEQYLPEEDRAQLHEALGRIDQEKLDQAEIIRAGAACLAAAVG